MIVHFTDEHRALRETVADLRRAHATHFEAVRDGRPTTERWAEALAATGLVGVAVPEQYDGGGGDLVDLVLVAEELGHALDDSLLLPTAALAVPALVGSDDEGARARLLPALASGATSATVAWREPGGDWRQSGGFATTATPAPGTEAGTGAAWTLDGVKDGVLGGASADVLLVVARAEDGVGFFEVAAEAPGLTRTSLPGLDQTRELARLELSGVPARRLEVADGAALLERVLLHGVVVLAAERVGVAAEALDMTVGYAGIRHQFGRPIGSFQAVKHRAANMAIRLEVARSAAYYAAFALRDGTADAWRAVAAAQIVGTAAGTEITADCIQLHGGIGFTWEHPAHHYFKRARASAVLLGSARDWERHLGDDLVTSPLIPTGAS